MQPCRCWMSELKETYTLFNFLLPFCHHHPVQHPRMGQVSVVIPIGPTDVQQAVEVLHRSDVWSHGGCKEGKRSSSEQEAKD